MSKKMKRCLTLAASLLIGFGSVSLVGCNNKENTNTPVSQYKVVVNAIGSTTINASKTLQLRANVTGTTEKDVTWSSSDETVASVSEKGVVTGIKAGTVKIRATLNIDSNAYGEVEVTVLQSAAPTSLKIEGIEPGLKWVGDSASLSIKVEPIDASSLVTWETTDANVASISEKGEVEFKNPGNVTIKATSKEDPTVFASLDFVVKYGTFSATMGSLNWDISKQADETKKEVSLDEEGGRGYNTLYFTHSKGTRYYAEAFFKVTTIVSDYTWAWQGVGLGSGLSDTNTRYFTFSPHSPATPENSFHKTIVRDRPTSWDALTTRSQIWGENGLDEIDCINNGVKVGLLRDENKYYYLLNDSLFYVDETTKYDGVETYPILVAEDLPVKVTQFLATTDETKINNLLNSATFKKSFFASNPSIVNYESDDKFSFDSNTVLSKDNKVRSLGDKAKVTRNFEVECDISLLDFNNTHIDRAFTGMTINFTRYDSADAVESMMIGRSGVQKENTNIIGRYASWNYQKSMDDASSINKYLESSNAVMSDANGKIHVKITRTIDENNKSNFALYVDNNLVDLDVKSTATVTPQERYTGAYLIWVGGEYTSGQIENFVFRNLD